METFEKEKQIIQYLDKKYVIKENCFITKYGDEHHWGYEIAEDITNKEILCIIDAFKQIDEDLPKQIEKVSKFFSK
jgi:hypothetical protein